MHGQQNIKTLEHITAITIKEEQSLAAPLFLKPF